MRAFLLILCLYFLTAAKPVVSNELITRAIDFALTQDCLNDYAIFIDMSLPSNEKRWFVVDLHSMKTVYKTYVAHGKGSGEGKLATCFSDKPGSCCTALGIYKIAGSYIGSHGLAYLLDGLEETNKNAMSRNIVIHSAWYADEDFIASYGRCGNSWGCPAISEEAMKICQPYLKPGTLVWIYR
ncbi:MAG: murein L,D-transpeptidase catalytic domain family protein [Bacteroidia bacterium]